MTKRQARITRDGAIVTVALALSTYEVVLGDGRPAVLGFLGGLLISPLLARLDRDQSREERRGNRDDEPVG
jgi:hypothetical protein